MVGAEGFEPPTSCSQSRRATRLRHAPTLYFSTTCRDFGFWSFSLVVKTVTKLSRLKLSMAALLCSSLRCSIPLDHLDTPPATQLLNRPQIRARHCKSRGKCMSQNVRRDAPEFSTPAGSHEARLVAASRVTPVLLQATVVEFRRRSADDRLVLILSPCTQAW